MIYEYKGLLFILEVKGTMLQDKLCRNDGKSKQILYEFTSMRFVVKLIEAESKMVIVKDRGGGNRVIFNEF